MVPYTITKTDRKGNVTASRVLHIDEQYRPDIRKEDLARLKQIFGNPTCTAGNAPGLNDGAAAQIFMKRARAELLGLDVLYTVVAFSSIALQPGIMPVTPAFAIKRCLNETGLAIAEMPYLEINEAFSCVLLVSIKLLSNQRFIESDCLQMVGEVSQGPIRGNDLSKYEELKKRVNVNGCAIAVNYANTALLVI